MNTEPIVKDKAREFFTRGISKSLKKDYRGAIEDFNLALYFNPHDADAYGNRCVALYKNGDRQRAIEDCKLAATLYLKQGKAKQYQYALKMQNQLTVSM